MKYLFKLKATILITGSLLLASNICFADGKPVTEQLVDSFTKLANGPHKGYRVNHAKGVMAEGVFTPSPLASSISKAAHLQTKTSNIVVRFSNGTGIPDISDANPNANPKGIAIRFTLPDGTSTDIVSISINSFLASTPEEFLELLNAAAESGPQVAKPTPIDTFLGTHPAAVKFLSKRPSYASFATMPFYGVNAFKFTNSKGLVQYGRYQITPIAGLQTIGEEEAMRAQPNYLMDEIVSRLNKSEVKYRLALQIADEGDATNDSTVVWPDSRRVVELGVLTLKTSVPNSKQEEQKVMFNPLSIPEGINTSDDPILLARPISYAISYSRRLTN
ncbi:catalase family peroxidase [Methylotenera sp.]|uniref:catalase family peroxidase n=1 Tax=Methylotenera sp. TaxID=2051956 RepID=UPI0027369BDB|nr:catalase family peroxidase [Methylotenera sp.]MDP3777662.1 catalase family peroxidase [Methylotenera sp.]